MRETNEVTRFELITEGGRHMVHYGKVQYLLQDEGRTLKVFMEEDADKASVPETEDVKSGE